jgi:hypothetical protein
MKKLKKREKCVRGSFRRGPTKRSFGERDGGLAQTSSPKLLSTYSACFQANSSQFKVIKAKK